LVKVKDTPELKSVYDYEERLEQLKGAYDVTTAMTKGQDVLLIDDLYRSGATLEAATNALLRKGKARRVRALTFTRTRSNR
jgi:predicted amidophosphoribosyltransferase